MDATTQKHAGARVRFALAAAAASMTLYVHAQEPTFVLGEVTVAGERSALLRASQILTSVDVIDGARVREQNVGASWEVLGLMPGIQLTEFRMGAESGKPSLRAFNGEGYINAVKLLIDGIPSNVNSGNLRHFDMIFPIDIDYIEVVRGTNDARYGLHNIAGNIHVVTRSGGNYTEGRATYGSFATRDLQAAAGREHGILAHNYFFAYQRTDGYREHALSEKFGVGGKWFLTPRPSLRLGLIARLYEHEAQEPGYLTAAELSADRRQSPAKNANDNDSREMKHLSAHLEYVPGELFAWASRLYLNTIDDDRRVTFSSFAGSTLPRQRRHWIERHLGWLNTLTWRGGDVWALEAGFNIERQDNQYQRYRYAFAVPTDFSSPAATANDDAYTLTNVGAYVQAVFRPAADFKLVPAWRVDRFSGEATRRTSGLTAPLQDYGWIHQPKLSAVYRLTPSASLYLNWGRTFQILTGSWAPAYLAPGTAAYWPSINTGYELGGRLSVLEHSELRLALWRQDATDEVANLPSAGATQNLGATRRQGVDLQATVHVGRFLKAWLFHALQEAVIRGGYSAGGNSLAGKEVFSTPRWISNFGIEYVGAAQWKASLLGRAQGSYFIDDQNALGKFGGYVLFDASVSYQLTPRVGLQVQVRNLLDRKYEYVWYDNFFWPPGSYQPMFSPGTGRAFYATLSARI
ncbi:MAG: TonB-dependent receptor [Sutterellaceae bacterium]|nr:TonB-dependent receptor [Burkholderiaceae bacterium]MDW8430283.1 TonB-dependent receptor [Sutterellaceae bacterium]